MPTNRAPESSALLARSWRRCAAAVTARPLAGKVFDELVARYSEPHRKYHTLQHLAECLAHVEAVGHLAEQPGEVEIALWFHDGIYDTQGHDNERQSADWARAVLEGHGAPPATVQRVDELVMATCHSALPVSPDAKLLVDVDLSILGALPPRFAEYEEQIRQEYAFVPEELFRRKRGEILGAFLARPAIYSTPYFQAALEARARDNLRLAIAGIAG
jgi:predicted metal-dependent HD superfamily phosphohydrolase